MTIDKNFSHSEMTGRNKSSAIEYGVDETVEESKCRLVMNGHNCGAKMLARGLCSSHYKKFRALDDNSLELYGLPPRKYTKSKK